MAESTAQARTCDTQLFHDVFNASPVGIAVENLEGQPLFVNRAFCSFLGFSEEELCKKHWVDFSPPEDAEKDWALFQQLRAGSIDRYQLEKRYFRQDGSLVWGQLSVSLLKGRPSPLVLAMVEDITDKKKAEEARFRHAIVIESSDDAIASATLDGIIVSWNKGAEKIYGYAEAEAVGKPINMLVPAELSDEENKILETLKAGRRIEHFETVRVTKTGKRINVSLTISPINDSSGRTVGCSGIARDITERKRAEEALRESEERFRLATQVGKMYAYEWDVTTDVVMRSSEHLKILGLTEPLRFPHQQFVEKIHPDDRPKFLAAIGALTPENPTGEVTYRALASDGSLVWLKSNGRGFFDREGRMLRVIGMVADVTDQKLAEEAVHASEERLRLAQQAASIGTFEWNTRTGANTWTPELEAMYGLPPGGFGGTQKAFESLVHPDDLAGVIALIDGSLKSGQPAKGEWRVVWPDESVHWIAGRWQVFMDASGEPSRVIGVNIDVTERKRSEERLREYEEAVEGAEDVIGVIDREYRLLLANRQYLKMRNLTREQVVGHFASEVLGREAFETVIKPKLDECFQGKVVKYEMRFSYPAVGERDLSLSYFPIKGENGIDRVACILRDITDRKRAEEALLEMNRALEAQASLLRSREELLKTFVKNVPAAVAMLDREMRYLQVSDRWCTDYLPSRAQILGRSHYEIFPDMPERWKEVHRRCLEGETLRADEDRWDGKDGPHWARWEVRPWKTAEGTVGGILILAEDITRRKQMEETLSTLSRKLIDSQEQERARIGSELHDNINQQIAMLAVELEQLQNDPSDVQNRLQDLQKQMSELSSDVQALSHDLHPPKLEHLGVVLGIKSWCREFGERQRMTIDFRSDAPGALPLDVGRTLFRLLQEALHNASKYSGVKRVDVHLRKDPGDIHLTIRDEGKGFDIEAARQGGGLGLASMEERVRLVKGNIEIQSKPMGGTTIHVRVPLESDDASQRAVG